LGIEYLSNRFVLLHPVKDIFIFWNIFRSSALVTAALFVTLSIAGGLAEAIVLSFGFTSGIALALAIAGEIRRRSEMEAVPRFLRGGPLVLVTLGLLSLVFTSAALMFFEVLGAN
jgi:electron transport complex protein RnfA